MAGTMHKNRRFHEQIRDACISLVVVESGGTERLRQMTKACSSRPDLLVESRGGGAVNNMTFSIRIGQECMKRDIKLGFKLLWPRFFFKPRY